MRYFEVEDNNWCSGQEKVKTKFVRLKYNQAPLKFSEISVISVLFLLLICISDAWGGARCTFVVFHLQLFKFYWLWVHGIAPPLWLIFTLYASLSHSFSLSVVCHHSVQELYLCSSGEFILYMQKYEKRVHCPRHYIEEARRSGETK